MQCLLCCNDLYNISGPFSCCLWTWRWRRLRRSPTAAARLWCTSSWRQLTSCSERCSAQPVCVSSSATSHTVILHSAVESFTARNSTSCRKIPGAGIGVGMGRHRWRPARVVAESAIIYPQQEWSPEVAYSVVFLKDRLNIHNCERGYRDRV